MKRFSTSLSYRLARHLSTTAAATTTSASGKVPMNKATWLLRDVQDPDQALQIYSSLFDTSSTPTSPRSAQQIIVDRFAKANRFDEIESFLESQKKHPKITQERFVCLLIRCYGMAAMFDNALKLYGQMGELGAPRTCLSFNALLYAADHSKAFDRVPQLFAELPERHGFQPSETSYGILIKSYCDMGDTEMALKVFGEMGEKGVDVTALSLTILFDALCENGKKDEAERVWGEVVGKGCVLDVQAWNTRISHAVDGSPETVKGFIDEMVAAGLKPDSNSYTHLLACYCKSDRLDEAVKVFDELEKSGFKPKTRIFKTLIHYLCKKEDYARGYDVFKKIVKYRWMPDFETLAELVKGMAKDAKMRKDAKNMIEVVKKKFPPGTLDAWKKVEVELGLVSEKSTADSDVPEAEAAAKY